MFFKLFRVFFSDIYLRKIAYFVQPLIGGMLVFSIYINSSPIYIVICSLSFFFCFDSIALKGPDLIIDISKFYFLPKSRSEIFIQYLKYRAFNSFILNLIPSLIIFTILHALLYNRLSEAVGSTPSTLYWALIFVVAWLLYIVTSTPMVILALRDKLFAQIILALCYPFYLGLLVYQLHANNMIRFNLADYNAVLLGLFFVIFLLMIYSFYRLIKTENLFPSLTGHKRGV